LIRRAYLDTCIVIYLIEDAGRLSERTREFLARSSDTLLCVSPLVRLEAIIKPLRESNTKLVADDEDFLAAQRWLGSDGRIFDRACQLRAGYGLKTPDALHLATVLHYGCDEFWTRSIEARRRRDGGRCTGRLSGGHTALDV
jgi:predicted nucleic acid-binding protein